MEYSDYDEYIETASEAEAASINKELRTAEKIMKQTNANLFLTGRAGTGKTTFLRRLLEETPKRSVVLAPTGVAAINAGGVTIHSFFQLPFHSYIPGVGFAEKQSRFKFSAQKRRLIRSLELLVIDEISMVRPDTLDAIDDVLRRTRRSDLPFGGVQLLLIGDLRQLAPVVKDDERQILAQYYQSPYFFESAALQRAGFYTIELTTIYRQSDPQFISILNAIRDGVASNEQLSMLNTRYSERIAAQTDPGFIRLTTHNNTAFGINATNLDNLPGEMTIYHAVVNGNFPESSYPADATLALKRGAQVMFLKNDPSSERQFYNGLLGKVKFMDEKTVTVAPVDGGADIIVGAIEWQNLKYELDDKTNEIKEIVDGTFAQIPLRTAWAITIHKSQGLTFDHCIVDASRSFAPGQAYVALSRCRTFEGLMLDKPLTHSALICDPHVNMFMQRATESIPDDTEIDRLCRNARYTALSQLFDFTPLRNETGLLLRVSEEFLSQLYPNTVANLSKIYNSMAGELVCVAARFCSQYGAALSSRNEEAEAAMMPRINAGCIYFLEKLRPLQAACLNMPKELDNKEKKKRLEKALSQLQEMLEVKCRLLKVFSTNPFSVNKYSETRCRIYNLLDRGELNVHVSKKTKATQKKAIEEVEESDNEDIPNIKLYRRLVNWRKQLSQSKGVPAFAVLSNKTLINICRDLPVTLTEFGKINGIGIFDLTRILDNCPATGEHG